MKMLKIFFFFLIFVSFNYSQNKIEFSIDYSRFQFNSDTNYVEIYYRINKNTLERNLADSTKKATLHFTLVDSTGTKNYIKTFYIQTKSDSDFTKNDLVGQFPILLGKEIRSLNIVIKDENSNNTAEISEKIEFMPFHEHIFSLSDIQLARNIEKSEEIKNIFFKNTYKILPNTDNIFTSVQPVLFYYFEIYNSNQISANSGCFGRILDNDRKEIMKKEITFAHKSSPIVKVNSFILKNLSTGSYFLEVIIIDTLNNYQYKSYKKFYFVSDKEENTIVVLNNYNVKFASYSEEECDLFFDKLRHLSLKSDKEMYSKLNSVDGKREFLSKLWQKQDNSPSSDENEFMNEYLRKLDYVEQKFKTQMYAGYKSDMGRIYLTYGVADTIDRYPNNISGKSYEIWTYSSIEGGVYFVFVDALGIDEFQLTHSTKRGEVYNPNWQEQISND